MARIAERQRGLIGRTQLIEAGITPDAIRHRLATGRLHTLYRGIYVVGRPRLEPLAAATAAVMHLGGRGVLSHRTAAMLWGILDTPELPVEITVVDSDLRPRPGLTVRRSRTLSEADIRRCQGLPVTSPARTLIDLAGILDLHELEAVYAMAIRRRLVTRAEVAAAIRRAPRGRGAANLRALVEQGARPVLTRSHYERKVLDLIRRAELPAPQVNATIDGMEVDFLWPEQKLVVEFDGFAYHSDRSSFEQDRLRDQRLAAAGYRVLRITARQVDNRPEALIARLAIAAAR